MSDSVSAVRPLRRNAIAPAARRGIVWGQALGLDAVAVALVWQEALGRVAQQAPLLAGRVGLALVVAFIYVLDRQLDAAGAVEGERLSHRHRVHVRFGRFFRVVLALLAAGILAVIPAVRFATLEVAAGLAVLVGIYLTAVQLLPRWMRTGTKELTVGLVFAAGCAAHALPRQPHHDLFPTLALTGLLFALNCVSISTREAEIDRAQGAAGISLQGKWFAMGLVGLSLMAVLLRSPLMVPIVLSAGLLGWLHFSGRRTLLHHLGADAALLTPLLLALPM